jgi:DNA-binding NarL/FixJ family response regulator
MEIEDLLVEMGAEIVGTASTADEAIRLADTKRPDCLTMDISINGNRDGVRAAIEIYERFGIRSVFVSAFGDPQTVARAQFANPVAWVSKPVSKSELGAALSAVPKD